MTNRIGTAWAFIHGMFTPLFRSAMIHWTITFGLLALVTGGFAVSGTVSESLSLWVRALALVFLCLAVLMIFIKPGTRGTR